MLPEGRVPRGVGRQGLDVGPVPREAVRQVVQEGEIEFLVGARGRPRAVVSLDGENEVRTNAIVGIGHNR